MGSTIKLVIEGPLGTKTAARARTRALASPALAAIVAITAACSAEQPRPIERPTTATAAPPAPKPPPPPEYLIADLSSRPKHSVIQLDKPGRSGVLLEGARFIVEDGRARAVGGSSRASIDRVERIPKRLGGGFLFIGGKSLFSSDTFEGKLNPIITLPESVSLASFGPKNALVRGGEGGRWAFELPAPSTAPAPGSPPHPQDPWAPRPQGAEGRAGRVPIAPVGLVDIAALDDGRALGITEGGGALMSRQGGDRWDDITAKLSGPPESVVVQGDDLYITDESGAAFQLDKSGSLIELDHLPKSPQSAPPARDPRWHASTAPRELALAAGAKLDNDTAVVAASGDVAIVDLRSGDIKAITQGHLPPNLICEAIRVPDDVLIACSGPGGPSVVASGVLNEDGIRIEKTFPSERPFYASDEGTLVFAGRCSSDPPSPWAACARDLSGHWQEHSVEAAAIAGEKDTVLRGPIEDVRWVPRPDKPPLAILVRAAITVIDPTTGEPSLWDMTGDTPDVASVLAAIRPQAPRAPGRVGGPVVDRSWAALPSGSLRGWFKPGRSVDISSKGVLTFSPFRFDSAVVSGATALSLTTDNRLWQTTDRGASWVEIATPPSRALQIRSCSPVGCNMGLWHRIGWEASAPDPKAPSDPEPAPPLLSRPALPEIICSPTGEAREASVPQSDSSPGDLGIGAARTPFSTALPSGQLLTYRKATFSRTLNNPPRSTRISEETCPFGMVHNFAVDLATVDSPSGTTNTLVVLGPSPSLATYRQTFTFLAPFDRTAALRSPFIGVSAVSAAARAAGAPLEEALTNESDSEGFVPILPVEPGAAADLLFVSHLSSADIMGVITAGQSGGVKLTGLRRSAGTPISAAALAGGEIAVLSAAPNGGSRVLRLGPGGATDIGGLPGPPSDELQPANPDALALGPHGELAILRTPSGDEPASASDPALLIELAPGSSTSASVPMSRIKELAPWSTLTSAADPACQSDTSGYRAVLQTKSPWIWLRGAKRDANLASTVMMAEVRWSNARVCLEAIELPERTLVLPDNTEMQTMIIARFASPSSGAAIAGKIRPDAEAKSAPGRPELRGAPSARVGVTLGAELRQPLSCSLAPR